MRARKISSQNERQDLEINMSNLDSESGQDTPMQPGVCTARGWIPSLTFSLGMIIPGQFAPINLVFDWLRSAA